ncbi:putative glycoside hydrolase [Spirochaetia bacterium 38H-sp]|uniref:Glycoside hydrolase n=1 Tax=Rarispira pelagica TaxID=3141764 RepID=A0ABU9U8P7_9SPIR
MQKKIILFFLVLIFSFPIFSQELPATEIIPVQFLIKKHALYVSADNGKSWQECNIPGLKGEFTSFSWDRNATSFFIISTMHQLAITKDSGLSWKLINVGEKIESSTHIRSIAIDKGKIYLGTSFGSVRVSTDGGNSWKKIELPPKMPFFFGGNFYEEIAGIAPFADGFAVLLGFKNGEYLFDASFSNYKKLEEPDISVVRQIFPEWGFNLQSVLNSSYVLVTPDKGSIIKIDFPQVTDMEREKRLALAYNKYAIYIRGDLAKPQSIDKYIELIKEHGFNAAVIDFKDENGLIRYDSKLELPQKIGAVRPFFTAEELIKKLHENNIYVIARIAVFKDKMFSLYDGSKYAFMDSRTGKPWGVFKKIKEENSEDSRIVQVEYWTDAFSEDVRKYNVSIAEEIASLGADEIQFDYIRFPSDGEPQFIVSKHKPDNWIRSDALVAFLKDVREKISVPISVDVFGFNATSRMTYLGQDITRLWPYIDVLCPMYYPSHYGDFYRADMRYLDRARWIYQEHTRRAALMTENNIIIRPYVQAFLLGGELKFDETTYYEYLRLQIEGSLAGGGSGYTLWNASGRYYMVPPDFRAYQQELKATAGESSSHVSLD